MDVTRKQFLAVLAGLGLSTARAASTAHAAEFQGVTIMTDGTAEAMHSPLYLAAKKGWFRESGLDVTIKDGRGSANTVTLVGSGQIDFGFANIGAMIIAASKGVPVVATGTLVRVNGTGLVMLKDKPLLRSQEDCRGKEILYNTASIERQLLTGWLALGGMKPTDVKLIGVDGSAKVPSFVAGKGDAAVGPVPFYAGLLEAKGGINSLGFAEAGQSLLDTGIFTSTSLAKSRPAAAAAFTKAVSRAFAYAVDGHIEESVDAMIAMRPDAQIDRKGSIAIFNSYIPYVYSKTTKGKPVGYISAEDVDGTIQTLSSIGLIDGKTKAADVYTTEFMPA